MSSKWKWLLMLHLLLSDQTLCRAPAPPGLLQKDRDRDPSPPPLGPNLRPSPPSALVPKQDRILSAERTIQNLRDKLQRQVQDQPPNLGAVSCEELLSASALDDPSSSLFPQELLGFSLVPVLVMAGCWQEAQTLVLRLHGLLGETDAEELLMELEDIIEKKPSLSGPPRAAAAAAQSGRGEDDPHMEAVMFNIQQLADKGNVAEAQCEGWFRVSGTSLVGRAAAAASAHLDEALRSCESLGVLCGGVTSGGPLQAATYQAVLKNGSSVLPSGSTEGECWIHQCAAEEEPPHLLPRGRRTGRSAERCTNRREERVYHVMEWIPAVSTLYNLGTAVYYASLNCSQTAKQRAILSAVDLGTDAIMVATGGTAGVAGFALGAGVKTSVKTGIKYLFKSMREEDDVLVNQLRWEDGIFTTE